MLTQHYKAKITKVCDSNYTIIGNEQTFCDGKNWDRTLGTCQFTNLSSQTYCNFDSKALCGWSQDATHNVDWRWINKNIYAVGPKHDHTTGKQLEGYFLVIHGVNSIDATSARLISPIYDSKLSVDACFRFYYHMFGKKTGTIRVFIKPKSLSTERMLETEEYLIFEIQNTSKYVWREAVAQLNKTNEEFQV